MLWSKYKELKANYEYASRNVYVFVFCTNYIGDF